MNRVRPLLALLLGALLWGIAAQGAAAAQPVPNGEDEAKLRQCLEAVRKAHSDARACIGVVADPCLEQPDQASTQSMISCIDREVLLWDHMLTDRFGNLVTQLDEAARDQVREVQEAWASYRDKRCALGKALFPGGSLAGVWDAECLLQETGRRAIEVATLIDELNHD